ncbi:MAG: putative porin [Chthoniobacterales bacterium]|nr:putative porin [Chthoniobacterales bacterium]
MLTKICLLFATVAFVCAPIAVRAQESGALLDLLVKKKIITDQEAEELRGELVKDFAATPAGKLKMSTPITELEIYGDARVRYEIRNGNSGPPSTLVTNNDDAQQRNRARYRIRLGLRGTLVDDWFFGLRLETSTSPRSTNVTFGDDSGPFGKTSDGAFIGQAYVGYKGIRDLTLTAGRMPNPFITSSMVWDGDINPEGLAQQYKHTFNLSFGGGTSASSAQVESYSKDGKSGVAAAAAISEPTRMSVDVFANFGQFVYDDVSTENPLGVQPSGVPNTDSYLLGWQVGAKFNFTKDIYFRIAPTVYNYTGNGDSFNKFYQGDPDVLVIDPVTGLAVKTPRNQTAINSLLVCELPAEFGFKIGELPVRVFSDFAVNLDATDRARAAGHPDQDDERYAYQLGIAFGQLKAKHDWQIQAFYQHAEQYSLDPNLVDSDIFDSRLNMEGFAIQAGYAITDAVTFNLTYAYGEQINKTLGTGGIGDIGVNPLREYQLFQVDLNYKF